MKDLILLKKYFLTGNEKILENWYMFEFLV